MQIGRNSYEIRNNHIHGTLWGRISYEIRTKFVRNLHEFRTNFARISYEFRTNFVRISYHFCRTLAEEPHQHHLCNNEVPTPTHISLYLPPPGNTHTHTQTHTHTDTHTHPCTNTHIPSMKANSPPCTRPTPTHCPLTHPHTYLDSGCATVRCLGGGVLCVCVCMCVCLCVWMGFCGCVCGCGWVGRCVHV